MRSWFFSRISNGAPTIEHTRTIVGGCGVSIIVNAFIRGREGMKTGKTIRVRGDMLTTTISLAHQTHKRLKHLAVDQSVAVRDLIRAAIEEYLDRQQKEKSSMEGSMRA
jgi:hypothetical protein